jgi:hypothetical protein
MLRGRDGFSGQDGGRFVVCADQKKIFDWCKNHSPNGAGAVAAIMPTSHIVDEKWSWHPFARALLDRFGNSEAVISGLSRNLGTYGWTGSLIPRFRGLQSMMEELFSSPHSNLVKWAKDYYEYLSRQIEHEARNEQESKFCR